MMTEKFVIRYFSRIYDSAVCTYNAAHEKQQSGPCEVISENSKISFVVDLISKSTYSANNVHDVLVLIRNNGFS